MTSQKFELSRRGLLQALGVGAAGAAGVGVLGACQADGGSGSGDGASGKFVTVYPFDITTQHYNAAINNAALLIASPMAEVFYPRPALLDWSTLEWIPMLAEAVSLDGTTLTMTLRQGVKWTDGNDVTAKDVVGTLYMQKLNAPQGTLGWDQFQSATADGDHTVVVSYSEAFPGVEHGALKVQVNPYARYGDWMDRAQELVEAGSVQGDDDQSALAGEIAEEDFAGEGFISCGPYKLDQVSDTVVTMTVHEGGLWSDEVAFETVEVQKGDNAASVQMLLKREIDYSTLVLGAAERATIEAVEGLRELSTPGFDGVGLMLNQGRHPEFADARVRKALMYILDGEVIGEIAKGAGGYYLPSTYTGLPDPHAEGLFDGVDLEFYRPDHEKAASLLEDAGWTKEDDGWHKPDGSKASYKIIAPEGWSDFTATGEQSAGQFSEFGLGIVYENIPADNPWGVWGAGDYDIAVRHWANPFVPYVYGSWQMSWFTDNSNTDDAPGMAVPTDAVATDSLGTVNVDEQFALSQTGSEEEQAEANRALGIVFNETLPRLPVFLNQRVTYGIEGVRVAKVDAGSYPLNDIYFDNPIMLGVAKGTIDPV
jgi:peptide/nickel transport system substrate-binding protein